MPSLQARFTLTYSLIVLAVTAALAAWIWYLIGPLAAGWSWRNGMLMVTKNTVKMVLLTPLMLAVFATQVWELVGRKPVLILTASGLHDRRLTRGPLLWSQIERIIVYRKGWQYVAQIEPKALTTESHDMGLGPMPVYAFNRLCARFLKRSELIVGLGGMTASSADLLAFLRQYFKGELQQ